ncbi:hypothetical protein ACFW04_013389 [Cataglyphis niger]
MRPTTSCAATVKAILYSSFIDTAATKYGCENEEVVRNELAIQLNKEIKPCGLFIDTENPCLGASPDGLIDDNGLVEIKCPLSTENLTAEKAIKTLLSLKGIFEKRNPHKMNRKHRYYYQIQGQLNITQREYFIFAVWTPKSMKNIANPKYIMEAKEEAAKKLRSQSRRNITESENSMEDSKRFKSNVSPMEVTMTDIVTIALNEEQDVDCIIIKTSSFETQSVLYLEYPHIIVASHSDKSVQIIGGNCSNHWRCIFFDGTKLRVYDSLPGCTYDKLVAKKKVIYIFVETQPDGTSCGIYAAAFATTAVLGGNPCKEKYSKKYNKLLPFPK